MLRPSVRSFEAEAILEVSYLAMAADRSLRDEEIAAFEMLTRHVLELVGPDSDGYRTQAGGAAAGESERRIAERHDRYALALERDGRGERLAMLARSLARPAARDLAYQLAYLMALADLDASEHEAKFDDQLKRALALTDDWAEALADDVLGALDGGERGRSF